VSCERAAKADCSCGSSDAIINEEWYSRKPSAKIVSSGRKIDRHHGGRFSIDRQRAFPVVGIGASAGGLEAMNRFFDAATTLEGSAFVVVQHLDPKGESHLADLLSRHTALRVAAAKDGTAIEPGHVYVCVPNHELVVRDGRLRLLDPELERSQRRPIDRLFDSLATEYGERAVAIILSGTAADGSRGISSIKAEGGTVLVQEPSSAEFDGMPNSAIGTGLVDLVLPIGEMPDAIGRMAANALAVADGAEKVPETEPLPNVEPATLQHILDVMHDRFEYDFNDYKRPTLLRRTQRRMSLRNIDDFAAYATLVRKDSTEAAALFRDLMINVSSFFRDREAWECLSQEVIDPLLESRETGDEVRVWSVGCATGEEAYTIGMLLAERMEATGKRLRPQIFATDVSDSLAVARVGRYPLSIASELSPERLERFFMERDGMYEVKKRLRDTIVFARHNAISDPPFSRMDLICCRNMLIYIEPETQQRILWMFNFALRDGGALFLGSAETVGMQFEMFDAISAPYRIFRSRRIAHASRFDFPRFTVSDRVPSPLVSGRSHRTGKDEYLQRAQRALLGRYAPPSVVIDAAHQVLVYHGDTSEYLAQPGGEPTRDLLAMVSQGIRPPLRHAITEALGEHRPTVDAIGFIKSRDARHRVAISVMPLSPPPEGVRLLLVSFSRIDEPTTAAESVSTEADGGEQTVDQLEEELRLTRQDLRDISEQYDRLVEEYSTSNEEMLSVNEELQSANEELETSKEELQSLNEELNTLNNELRAKVEVVEQTNNDLNNLLASTEIATLFLDPDCRIRWFTPAITGVLKLIASDVGRPISDLASTVTGSHLDSEARRVLASLIPVETEVDGEHGRCYLRRVLPYRTSDNRIDGVVATFVDITVHKRGERQRERLMHELSHRIKNTLATVQAIAQGLGRRSSDLPGFIAAFEPRLAALARAHALLTLPGDDRIDLRHLLDRELLAYVGAGSTRVVVDGGDLTLAREPAIALEMVFHELLTNATKYGALSVDSGTIGVSWRRVRRADGGPGVRLEWIESGGPPVAKPAERGFGSLLIQSSIEHDLAGTVTMEFERTGLRCAIEFPIQDGEIDGDDQERETESEGRRTAGVERG